MMKTLLAAASALASKAAFLAIAVFLLAGGLEGQGPPDPGPGRSVQTRADLERLLAFYDEVALSPAYSGSMRASAQSDANRIRSRLVDGDFRLGDRIVLYVQGEPDLPDTVAIQAGPIISLPLFGDISLQGVLRSEIQEHLTDQLSGFIRSPVVRAQGLMRVSIQGAVAQPGFYVVPADMLLGEALMVAGGPSETADIDGLRIERGPDVLVDGEELQEATRAGRTLDQLNLQAGDQIVMPRRGNGILAQVGIVAGIIASLAFLIVR